MVVWIAAGLGALGCTGDPAKVNQPPNGNRPPSAVIDVPLGTPEGAEILFDGSGSSDPEGGSLTYLWDFGDHGTSTARSARHAFPDEGVYIATLTVRDAQGASSTDSVAIQVVNFPPVFTTLKTHPAPLPTEFAVPVDIVFFDPGLADRVTAHIEWGDGAVQMLVSDTTILSHTYNTPGRYTITVTATDGDGGTGTRATTVDIFDGYEVIDLGTLGGNAAFPVALNDRGQVVGQSTTADGRVHAFLWDNGVMRDLSEPGDLASEAQAITNSGVIAGYVSEADAYGGVDPSVVVWRSGTKTELGAVRIPYYPVLDSSDESVGVVALTTEDVVAWGYTYDNSVSAIWVNGVKQRLGDLHGRLYGPASARAMNNRRQIVGISTIDYIGGLEIYRAFIWENGAMRELKTPGFLPCGDDPERDCTFSLAVDINSVGTVVGYYTPTNNNYQGLRWVNDQPQLLGFEEPVAINSAGEVAGNDSIYRPGNGIFWRNQTLTRFRGAGGDPVRVTDMNDLGMITGHSVTTQGTLHVFVWKPGQQEATDLGVGLPASGGDMAGAIAMNARGDIIGWTTTCVRDYDQSCRVPYRGGTRAILWRVKP